MKTKTTALILAAGEAKRYGSNKLLAPYKGKPLLQYVVELVDDCFEKKVIVLGKYQKQIESKLNLEQFIVVYNENYKEGLSSSLKKGILKVHTPWTMIFLGDMPEIQKEFIDILYEKMIFNYKAYYLSYKRKKGFPVLISKDIYPQIFKINGDVGLRHILKDNTLSLSIEINDPRCIIDVDKKR